MDSPPTMRDLARALKLSATTVSRALRNDINVSAENRERVQRMAVKMGYELDPNVSLAYARLRVKRPLKERPVIAVITASREEADWKHRPYFAGFIEHIGKRTSALGYRFEIFSVNQPGMSGQRLANIIRARGIAGVIIAPDLKSHEELSMDLSPFAVSMCTHVVWRPSLHRVEPHSFQNALLAIQKLLELGYQRIGFASFASNDKACAHHAEAAYYYCAGSGMLTEALPVHVENGMGGPRFVRWLQEHRPAAILASHADATFKWLASVGLRPGVDIGVAGAGGVIPGVTQFAGIDNHAAHIDAAVVDLVVEQINRNERGIPEHPRAILIEGSWVDGPTVRNVRKTSGTPTRNSR